MTILINVKYTMEIDKQVAYVKYANIIVLKDKG